MKIINELANARIKENRKDTLAIKASILMAVVLLGAIIFDISAVKSDDYKFITTVIGDYSLSISGLDRKNYEYLLEDESIEKVEFQKNIASDVAHLRLIDENAWRKESLNKENGFIDKGKKPLNSDEIMVPSKFLIQNKSYNIGVSIKMEDRIYTIVGTYNNDQFSFKKPSFLGVLKDKSKENLLGDNSSLDVNIWYKNPRDTYTNARKMLKELNIDEDLALSTGKLYYNIDYLEYKMIYPNGIFPPKRVWRDFLEQYIPLFLLSLLFAVMIYGAFNVWNNKDIREIALLKSVGMTGKQVGKMVRLKILKLSTVPIALGIVLSYITSNLILYFIWFNNHITYKNFSNIVGEDMRAPDFHIIVPKVLSVVVILILSYLSVYFSAIIPAIKSSKMEIVEGLKGILNKKIKPVKSSINGKIEKTLAKEYFRAYGKTYRVIMIAMILSALSLTFVLVNQSYRELDKKYNAFDSPYNFSCTIFTDKKLDRNLMKDLEKLKDEKHLFAFKNFKFFIKDNEFISKELSKLALENKLGLDYFFLTIYGLSKEDFEALLKENNMEGEADSYLLLNKISTSNVPAYKFREYISVGDETTSKISFRYSGEDQAMSVPISGCIYSFPYKLSPYSAKEISVFTSTENLENFISLNEKNEADPVNYYGIKANIHGNLDEKSNEYEKIIASYIPHSDYRLTNKHLQDAMLEEQTRNENLLLTGIQIILMILALSNAYNSFKGNINARKKDFRLLFTAGMTEKQLKKMIHMEGAMLFFKTVVIYLIIFFVLIMAKSYQSDFTFPPQELFMNLDFRPVLMIFGIYIFGIVASVKSSIKDVFRITNELRIALYP